MAESASVGSPSASEKPVIVTHIAWFHGTLAVFVHDPQSVQAIETALAKYSETPDAHIAGGDVGTASVTVRLNELQPFVTVVLANVNCDGVNTWYRARVDKLRATDETQILVSLTLIDNGQFVQDVPIENLRPISILGDSLTSIAGAQPRYVKGLGVHECHLNDPRQFYSAEVSSIISNNLWLMQAVVDEELPPRTLPALSLLEHDRVPTVELVTVNGISLGDLLAPHLQMDIDPPWLDDCAFLLTCRPPIADGEEVVVVVSDNEGQRLSVQLARYPLSELARLEAEIKQLAETKQLEPVKLLSSKDERQVAVPFDGDWKRGVILSPSGPRGARVWLADYGFKCTVPRNYLRRLTHDHADRLPPYGVRVDLRSPVSTIIRRVCLRNIELKPANGEVIADLEHITTESLLMDLESECVEGDVIRCTTAKEEVPIQVTEVGTHPQNVGDGDSVLVGQMEAQPASGQMTSHEISFSPKEGPVLEYDTATIHAGGIQSEPGSFQSERGVVNAEIDFTTGNGAEGYVESAEGTDKTITGTLLDQETNVIVQDAAYVEHQQQDAAVYEQAPHITYDENGRIVAYERQEGADVMVYDEHGLTAYEQTPDATGAAIYGAYEQHASALTEYQEDGGITYEDKTPLQYEGGEQTVYEGAPTEYDENAQVAYEGDVQTSYEESEQVVYEGGEQITYEQGAQTTYEVGAEIGYEAGVQVAYNDGTQLAYDENTQAAYDSGIQADYVEGGHLFEAGNPVDYAETAQEGYDQGAQIVCEQATERAYGGGAQAVTYGEDGQIVYEAGVEATMYELGMQIGYAESGDAVYEQDAQAVYEQNPHEVVYQQDPQSIYQQDLQGGYEQGQIQTAEQITDEQVYTDSSEYYTGQQESIQYESNPCIPEATNQQVDYNASGKLVPDLHKESCLLELISDVDETQIVVGAAQEAADDSAPQMTDGIQQGSGQDEAVDSIQTADSYGGQNLASQPISGALTEQNASSAPHHLGHATAEHNGENSEVGLQDAAATAAPYEPEGVYSQQKAGNVENLDSTNAVNKKTLAGTVQAVVDNGKEIVSTHDREYSSEPATASEQTSASECPEVKVLLMSTSKAQRASVVDDPVGTDRAIYSDQGVVAIPQEQLHFELAITNVERSCEPVKRAALVLEGETQKSTEKAKVPEGAVGPETRADLKLEDCSVLDDVYITSEPADPSKIDDVQVVPTMVSEQRDNPPGTCQILNEGSAPSSSLQINDTVTFEVVSGFSRSAAVVVELHQQALVQKKLKEIVGGQGLKPCDFRDVRLDMVVLVMSKDDGPYRAIVTSINRIYVDVQLLDYGCQVRVQEVFECPPELRSYQQARCKLELLDNPTEPRTPSPLVAGRKVNILCSLVQDDVVYGTLAA